MQTGKENYSSKFKRGSKKEVYIVNDDHEIYSLLKKAIDEHPHANLIEIEKIKCSYVYDKINDRTLARIIKCNEYIKHIGKMNFIIEVSGDSFDQLTDDGRYRVILHELLHIWPKLNKEGDVKEDDKGNPILGLVKHDLCDFRYIIKKFGIDCYFE